LFNWDSFQQVDAQDTLWDAVIVGAGMGGSTLGFQLALRGFKVLFLERGTPPTEFPVSLSDGRFKRLLRREPPETRLRAIGRLPRRITIVRDGQGFDFFAPIGSGPGGSSAIYGAGLERMRRVDFSATCVTGENPPPLADNWPIPYDDFTPYYRQAEALFGVAGTRDPDDPDDDSNLVPPPPLSDRDQEFFNSFSSAGLKPYRVHVGIAYKPGCRECLGLPCPNDCKADGSSRALRPALRDHHAKIVFDCEVQRLEASSNRVSAVVANIGGKTVKIRGRITVLAAGALSTPNLLRNSTSPDWPNGVGNHRDLVGRGLMFHASDLIALWPRKNLSAAGPRKTLAFRKFYAHEGLKLGTFQSLGLPVSHGAIFDFLADWIDRHSPVKIPLTRPFAWGLALAADRFFNRATVFATIIEDFPYLTNRVVTDSSRPSGFYIQYAKSRELVDRINTLRSLLKTSLAAHRPWIITGEDNMNLGHPSGTCRFGVDPATSVLDPTNKVHGVDNLYVVDASFFPSSSGSNPALTVAANALRVAEILTERLKPV
jgi:choline dehydrogenase-like flavoprotein